MSRMHFHEKRMNDAYDKFREIKSPILNTHFKKVMIKYYARKRMYDSDIKIENDKVARECLKDLPISLPL